jgi:hypothetical protein
MTVSGAELLNSFTFAGYAGATASAFSGFRLRLS